VRPPKFTSLWQGPQLNDQVESVPPPWWASGGGIMVSYTLISTGLYALDPKGAAWTLCTRFGTGFFRWFRVDELLSGAAARAVIDGPHPLTADGHCMWHGPNCSEVNVVARK